MRIRDSSRTLCDKSDVRGVFLHAGREGLPRAILTFVDNEDQIGQVAVVDIRGRR